MTEISNQINIKEYTDKLLKEEVSLFLKTPYTIEKTSYQPSLSIEDLTYLDSVITGENVPILNDVNQEIIAWKLFLDSKEKEISDLKDLLDLKLKYTSKTSHITESPHLIGNIIKKHHESVLSKEKYKNTNKINELKKTNDYFNKSLISEYAYYKAKKGRIKQNIIAKHQHDNYIQNLNSNHEKSHIFFLNKLLTLQSILNECEKALDSKQSITHNNDNECLSELH